MHVSSTRISILRSLVPNWARVMASKYAGANNGAQNGPITGTHTVTALNRWSILNKQLPAVDTIKAIHVYDFDNTLFRTPLPNPKLWNGQTIGSLASPDIFKNGGWWHDSRILAATGDGVEREEARAWEGWFNEKIVELVHLSMQQKDALAVLLTGRSERGFSDLLKRIVAAKGLDFDMIGLKPAVGPSNERFSSTMNFKQIFLESIMETYKNAEEIRIYEDRVRHVQGFRNFLTEYNRRQEGYGGQKTRGPIVGEVIQVADISTNLDPVVEVAEIQHLINNHNDMLNQEGGSRRGVKGQERLVIKKTVFFTSYMIDKEDTEALLSLVKFPSGAELKIHGNNIMICPRPCPKSIMDKVGGMGTKMKWKVTGTACFENSIWAASVEPVPATATYYTDNPSPLVVLALRKGARPIDAGKIKNWQPVPPEKAYVFETTVGEKVLLRIEPEDPSENEYESLFANKSTKRKHTGDEDGQPRSHANFNNNRGDRNFHSGSYGARGGGNQGRGGFRGNGTPNRGYRAGPRGGNHHKGGRGGRGGGHAYRSLDDLGGRDSQGSFGASSAVRYDDSFPPLPTQPQQQQQQPASYGQPYQQNFQTQNGTTAGRPMGGGGNGYGSSGPDLQNFY